MATEAPIVMSHQLHQPRSRPNSLLIPPNPAYVPTSPRGGILLNAARPTSLSPFTPRSGAFSSGVSTPRSPSPLSAAVSPDPTGNDNRLSVYSLGSRKIRFAPLPEPRRDDEDGAEIPCSATYPTDATSFPAQSPGAGPSVTFDRTDSLVTDSGASTNSIEAETQSQTSRTKAKHKSLLKLFGIKSSSKRTSTASLPTTDVNGTIGGIPVPGLGLFRPGSRESWSGELSGYTSDNSIARRMSSPLRPTSSRPGSSGGRTSQPNYGSYGAPLMQADGSGRQQRMLNGRVYGARRARERLQPLPSMEPEFSEWGYGGMGSVGTSGEYSKLQSKTSAVGQDDEEDDGSGMTWIRKRREKKEREERERKEAEAAAAAAVEAEKAEDPGQQRISTETADSAPTVHPEPAETSTAPPTPTGTAPPSRSNTAPVSPPRTHVTRTVSSPPSRQNSAATVTPDRHHPTVVAVPAHRGRQEGSVLNSGVVMSPETSPERSSGSSRSSSSSDDEDAEGSSSTTGRDEEEEEEEENQKRKTALSAGIEKISRHHA